MGEVKFYIKKYSKYILLTVLLIAVQTFFRFVRPLLIRRILKIVETGKVTDVSLYFWGFVGAFVLFYVFKIIGYFLQVKFSLAFKSNESRDFYCQLFNVEYEFIRQLDPTYFVNRIKETVDNIFNLVGSSLSRAVISFFTILVSLVLIFQINRPIFYLFAVLLPLNYFSYRNLNKTLKEKSSELQKLTADKFKNIINSVRNIEEIKQIGRYRPFTKFIGKYIDKIEKKNNEVFLYSKILSQVVDFVIKAVKNSILLLSIYLYLKQEIIFADIMFINMILSIYFSSLSDLNSININLRDVRASMEFIREEILSKKEKDEGRKNLTKINQIQFDINDFAYDSKSVLEEVEFKIQKGENIALVGKTGCGKSTLARLLLKFYEADKIKINQQLLKNYTLESIRDKIYLVTQNTNLFPGTIKENITIGLENYSEERLEEITSLPCFAEFLALPDGLDTEIREGASNFSGGQKQKIAIARMLMHNPEVVIFDESTSAIDSSSEDEIFATIEEFLKEKIVIIISHRLATVKRTDKIILLQQGKVKAIGTHNELLASSQDYNQLFSGQLGQQAESYKALEGGS